MPQPTRTERTAQEIARIRRELARQDQEFALALEGIALDPDALAEAERTLAELTAQAESAPPEAPPLTTPHYALRA